ncbi:MAG: response regulator transcription factor [Pseudomonadota bacterium]|nr:response regulator transcription factor [Pseudomonadota bacterium]
MTTPTEATTKPPVLLIEDERELADEIRFELQGIGHDVAYARTLQEGLSEARRGEAAVLIVDRMLNGEDGLSLVETLRGEGNPVPVLVISGLSTVDDRIRGLKAGGDDYLVKPFALPELSARVEALARRGVGLRATQLTAGPLTLDLVERKARRDGTVIELLPREFKLLEYFMRRQGQIVTRSMLLEDVWNYKFVAQTNVVDVHIGNLRRKLDAGDGRRFIVNVRAAGFKLDVEN